jgi:hypothetical protein
MEKILKKIEKSREQLVELAKKRDESFAKRSDKWQDSDKGIAFEVNTMLITDVVAGLDNAIYNANLYLKP